jgi:hypothetical protein
MKKTQPFIDMLVDQGVVETRATELADAFKHLNDAISALDNTNLEALNKKHGILGHLDMYARLTESRNNAQILHKMAIRRAVKLIDFDEFESFSDKLYYLAHQAEEVKIPGAFMLCNALAKIRRGYESNRGFFKRMARHALNIAQVSGYTYWSELNLHVSGPYKDHYSHLNEERQIGEIRVLQRFNRGEESYEHGNALLFVEIQNLESDVTLPEIQKAIKKACTRSGCSHEYDCCGCTSEYAIRLKRLLFTYDHQVWAVHTSWSRNL